METWIIVVLSIIFVIGIITLIITLSKDTQLPGDGNDNPYT